MLVKKTTTYFDNPTTDQSQLVCVEVTEMDYIPSDTCNDYMSEKYEEAKNCMIVYRLETNQGIGPFASCLPIPLSWYVSHFPPTCHFSPYRSDYLEWIKDISKDEKLPAKYKFAFSCLDHLKASFRKYERFKQLNLMEYVIDTSNGTEWIEFGDKQVIFCNVICSKPLK